jgi:site-specific DNA-cytosine methylase
MALQKATPRKRFSTLTLKPEFCCPCVIHAGQDNGVSIREAAPLKSFPDNHLFAGWSTGAGEQCRFICALNSNVPTPDSR